jgi:hypothetical protein
MACGWRSGESRLLLVVPGRFDTQANNKLVQIHTRTRLAYHLQILLVTYSTVQGSSVVIHKYVQSYNSH